MPNENIEGIFRSGGDNGALGSEEELVLLEFVLFESVFESFESVSSELVGKDASSVTSNGNFGSFDFDRFVVGIFICVYRCILSGLVSAHVLFFHIYLAFR